MWGPLASQLGVWFIKAQLEDHAFQVGQLPLCYLAHAMQSCRCSSSSASCRRDASASCHLTEGREIDALCLQILHPKDHARLEAAMQASNMHSSIGRELDLLKSQLARQVCLLSGARLTPSPAALPSPAQLACMSCHWLCCAVPWKGPVSARTSVTLWLCNDHIRVISESQVSPADERQPLSPVSHAHASSEPGVPCRA